MHRDPSKRAEVQVLRAKVRALHDVTCAARLDYPRAQMELRLLQGDAAAADRFTRQIRNLLNAERSKQSQEWGRSNARNRGDSSDFPPARVPTVGNCASTSRNPDATAAAAALE